MSFVQFHAVSFVFKFQGIAAVKDSSGTCLRIGLASNAQYDRAVDTKE